MLMQFTNISKNTIHPALKSTASYNQDYYNDSSQERPVSSAMVQHPSLADFMVFAGEVVKGKKKKLQRGNTIFDCIKLESCCESYCTNFGVALTDLNVARTVSDDQTSE